MLAIHCYAYVIQLVAVRRCFCFNALHTRRTPSGQCAARRTNALHTRWTLGFPSSKISQIDVKSKNRKDCLRHYAKNVVFIVVCGLGKMHPVRRTPSEMNFKHDSFNTTKCDLSWLQCVKQEIRSTQNQAQCQR